LPILALATPIRAKPILNYAQVTNIVTAMLRKGNINGEVTGVRNSLNEACATKSAAIPGQYREHRPHACARARMRRCGNSIDCPCTLRKLTARPMFVNSTWWPAIVRAGLEGIHQSGPGKIK
jgi:hypothetical protein